MDAIPAQSSYAALPDDLQFRLDHAEFNTALAALPKTEAVEVIISSNKAWLQSNDLGLTVRSVVALTESSIPESKHLFIATRYNTLAALFRNASVSGELTFSLTQAGGSEEGPVGRSGFLQIKSTAYTLIQKVHLIENLQPLAFPGSMEDVDIEGLSSALPYLIPAITEGEDGSVDFNGDIGRALSNAWYSIVRDERLRGINFQIHPTVAEALEPMFRKGLGPWRFGADAKSFAFATPSVACVGATAPRILPNFDQVEAAEQQYRTTARGSDLGEAIQKITSQSGELVRLTLESSGQLTLQRDCPDGDATVTCGDGTPEAAEAFEHPAETYVPPHFLRKLAKTLAPESVVQISDAPKGIIFRQESSDAQRATFLLLEHSWSHRST